MEQSKQSIAMAMAAEVAAANPDPALTDINYLNLQSHYIKSRVIGVLWAVFSLSFAIINAIVFVQPQWLGDSDMSRGAGYFGLWKFCRLLQDGQDILCQGKYNDLSSIQTTAFKVSTVFVALSLLMTICCVLAMLLFFFAHPCTTFQICAWLQFACGLCLLSGVLIFPAGWDSPAVKEVCGPEAGSYTLGQCSLRWTYILAIIGVIDAFALSTLAFNLGVRRLKLAPIPYQPIYASSKHGSLMGAPSNKGSLSQLYAGSQLGGGGHPAAAKLAAPCSPLVYWTANDRL